MDNAFICMSVSGGTVVLVWYLLYPFSKKVFNASWHYAVLKTAMVFMLLPARLLLPYFNNLFGRFFSKPYFAPLDGYAVINEQAIISGGTFSDSASGPIPFAPSDFVTGAVPYLRLIWLCAAAVMLIIFIRKSYRLKQQLMRNSKPCAVPETNDIMLSCKERLGLRKKVVLRSSEYFKTPIVTGIIRPVIIFPETDLSYDEKALALTHELTHIKNGDLWLKLIASAISILHWFNPLAHLLHRRIIDMSEIFCDERMVCAMSKDERKLYGNLILKVAAELEGAPKNIYAAFALSVPKHNIKQRLSEIMGFKKSRGAVVIISLLVMLICAASGGAVYALAAQGKNSEALEIQLDVEVLNYKQYVNTYNLYGPEKGGTVRVVAIAPPADDFGVGFGIPLGGVRFYPIGNNDSLKNIPLKSDYFIHYVQTLYGDAYSMKQYGLITEIYGFGWTVGGNCGAYSAAELDLLCGDSIFYSIQPTDEYDIYVGIKDNNTGEFYPAYYHSSNTAGTIHGNLTIAKDGSYSFAIQNAKADANTFSCVYVTAR